MKADISTDFLEYFQKFYGWMNKTYWQNISSTVYSENYLSACPSTSQKQSPMSFQLSMTPEKDTYSR